MGDYIGNRCLDMSLFLHFKVKITVFTYTVAYTHILVHLHTHRLIHLYTCTFICTVHLYICTPKHLCTCTVAYPCTLINLYTYPNVHPYILVAIAITPIIVFFCIMCKPRLKCSSWSLARLSALS